jgi:hypothetical protein
MNADKEEQRLNRRKPVPSVHIGVNRRASAVSLCQSA